MHIKKKNLEFNLLKLEVINRPIAGSALPELSSHLGDFLYRGHYLQISMQTSGIYHNFVAIWTTFYKLLQ